MIKIEKDKEGDNKEDKKTKAIKIKKKVTIKKMIEGKPKDEKRR